MNKKIIIIGCCGSGKSYFSMELGDLTGIPRYHLDSIYWQKDWVPLNLAEFRKRIKEITDTDSWIIDGNYGRTLEERFILADTVFFFDVGVDVCIESEKLRRGKKREDLPDYLVEEYDPEFINYIQNFDRDFKPKIMELIEKYPDKEIVIFKSRLEKDEYLRKLKLEL